MVAYRLTKADDEQALLYMYDVASKTWQKPYLLPPSHLIEYIDGFEFLTQFSAVIPSIAVNPAKRLRYVNGPNENELQEVTY
jgi:hypothetical protein